MTPRLPHLSFLKSLRITPCNVVWVGTMLYVTYPSWHRRPSFWGLWKEWGQEPGLPPRYGDTRGHSAAQLPRLPVSIPVVPAATAWVLTLPGPFSQQALLLAFLPESGTAWGTFEVSLFILTIKYYAEFTLSSCLVCLVALHAPPTACCPNGRPLVLKPQKP